MKQIGVYMHIVHVQRKACRQFQTVDPNPRFRIYWRRQDRDARGKIYASKIGTDIEDLKRIARRWLARQNRLSITTQYVETTVDNVNTKA